MKSGSGETYVLCTGIHNTCTARTTAPAAGQGTRGKGGRRAGEPSDQRNGEEDRGEVERKLEPPLLPLRGVAKVCGKAERRVTEPEDEQQVRRRSLPEDERRRREAGGRPQDEDEPQWPLARRLPCCAACSEPDELKVNVQRIDRVPGLVDQELRVGDHADQPADHERRARPPAADEPCDDETES